MACPEEEECQGKPGARTHSVRRVETHWQRGPAREENRRRRKLRHSRCRETWARSAPHTMISRVRIPRAVVLKNPQEASWPWLFSGGRQIQESRVTVLWTSLQKRSRSTASFTSCPGPALRAIHSRPSDLGAELQATSPFSRDVFWGFSLHPMPPLSSGPSA
uniref:Uncharacterized protein n=1 Tax=Rousettus aegyptiacus TaxID=9407 RepID=A0A7J8HTE2_ROUAE|nr:hypothetical protein HJG63_011090 [Rousettus aegyptiacus]